MKAKSARPPNPAARALQDAKFRQRIVKSKKHAVYSRKTKHKKGEDQQDDLSLYSDKTDQENNPSD